MGIMIDLSKKQRKGAGYMIEGIIAAVTIFVFAFGQSPAEPVQDWSNFQNQITANDLSYTLKQTGDLEAILETQNTGSLETAANTLTEGQLEVSGTIENLPLNDASIGFTSTNYEDLQERHTDQIRDLESDDRCAGDLEEIENQSAIKRTNASLTSKHDNVVLYFANTNPEISGGTDDYDTLYVDNGTRCQFSAGEGPIYTDEFFRWNSSTAGEYEYYDFKNIDSESNEFTYHNATLPFNFRERMNQPINGIETDQTTDTFNLDGQDLSVYDLIVIRREEAIEYLDDNNNLAEKENLTDFMQNKPILVLANISESNMDGFVEEIGLRWVYLSYSEEPSNPQFGDSPTSRKVETYFEGMNGELSDLDLPIGGKITSSNSDSLTQQEPLLYAEQGNYVTDPWDVSNSNMDEVDPADVDGEPESACYSEGDGASSALTVGTFSFPEEEYKVLNAEMAKDNCVDTVRAITIDNDGDEEKEGPFLRGEQLIVDNRIYQINRIDTNSVDFIFLGNSNPEIVNYRSSYEDFTGDQLARIGYEENYSDQDMKLISSTAYWLLGDTTEFGQERSPSVSTRVLGSINQNVYMPYTVSLRWR